MAAALRRDADLQRLPSLRRILELETDRAALVTPQARRTPTPQEVAQSRTAARNRDGRRGRDPGVAAERPSSGHGLRVSHGTHHMHPGCDSATG
jgi:hypothetical protein